MEPVERLSAVRELVWREEILLIPMHPDFESAIQETLDSIDCQSRTIDGVAAPDENWTAIREDWRNAAAALITSARFQFDYAAFGKAVESLEPFQDEDLDIRHRIIHEKCLWAIYDRDFDTLEELLTDWKPENCDPAWMMRKSAILWEAGGSSEAEEVLNNSITAIKAMRPDDSSLANLSRESWATFVALGWDNRSAPLDRLRELVPMRCDVFGERQSVQKAWVRTRQKKTLRLSTSIEGEVRANVGATTTRSQKHTGPLDCRRWPGCRHLPTTQLSGVKYLRKQRKRSPITTCSSLSACCSEPVLGTATRL